MQSRCKLASVTLFLLHIIIASPLCHGFSVPSHAPSSQRPPHRLERHSHHPKRLSFTQRNANTIILHSRDMDDNDDDQETRTRVQTQDTHENGAQNAESSSNTKQPTILQNVWEYISLFVSYITQFLGVAFSIGIILNICGYAYSFDLEHGLVIDTIQNVRVERQFEREAQRMESGK